MLKLNFVGHSLYHYTDIGGLKGIFSDSYRDNYSNFHIRFSEAAGFSDITEGKIALEVFNNTCCMFDAEGALDKVLLMSFNAIKPYLI